MALDIELLNKQEGLNGLSDDQKALIATLSANNEKEVIDTTFGKIHNELDGVISEITGVSKEPNEKTSEYMKRMLNLQKGSITELTGKVSDLEKKVKEGIDNDELKNQIASKDATIADLQKKFQQKADEIKSIKEENERTMLGYRISNDLSAAISGIEFAETTNEALKQFAIKNAMETVKGMNPTYTKGANGVDMLIFKNADGVEMRNPDNAMNLYTAQELLRCELTKLGVISEEKPGGAGGKNKTQKANILAGCATKTEAMQRYAAAIAERGIAKSSPQYQQELDKIYDENHDVFMTLK